MIGTLVAFLMVPMRSLGQDNWKIASALMGSYIGGCKLLLLHNWPAGHTAVLPAYFDCTLFPLSL